MGSNFKGYTVVHTCTARSCTIPSCHVPNIIFQKTCTVSREGTFSSELLPQTF